MKHRGVFLAASAIVLGNRTTASGTITPIGGREMTLPVASRTTSAARLAGQAARAAVRRANHSSTVPRRNYGALFHSAVVAPEVTGTNVATDVHAAAGLPATSGPVTTIGHSRNGAIHALIAAAAYLQQAAAPRSEDVLVTAGDVWRGPQFNRWAFQHLGDGGAAVVVSGRPAPAELLSTATWTDPKIHDMRWMDASAADIQDQTEINIERVFAHALHDAGIAASQVRYVITPVARRSTPRSVYLRLADAQPEHVAPFVDYGHTTGHVGPADLLIGFNLLGTDIAPTDEGDHVVLLADDAGAGAAAAVIRL